MSMWWKFIWKEAYTIDPSQKFLRVRWKETLSGDHKSIFAVALTANSVALIRKVIHWGLIYTELQPCSARKKCCSLCFNNNQMFASQNNNNKPGNNDELINPSQVTHLCSLWFKTPAKWLELTNMVHTGAPSCKSPLNKTSGGSSFSSTVKPP